MSNPSNVRLLYLARGIRGFGDGFATIILPAYLDAIGYDPVQIGIVLTGSLLGTAVFTLAIGFVAPRHDLRTLLLGGTALMVFTGLAFPNFQHIAVVVLVAFIGTINPSTGDLGILVPLEHAMLARGVADQERTPAFSRYSLIGSLSMAVGTLAAAFPDVLTDEGIGRIDAFRLMFYSYAVLGFACTALYRRLPHARMAEPSHHAPLGPSRHIVYRLAALFSLDAFAGGFVVQSLLALWLFERFDLSVSAASIFFFWAGILSASSYPRRDWQAVLVSSTPWCSLISRPTYFSSWRRTHPTCTRRSACCYCDRH
jgi:MFS family permease